MNICFEKNISMIFTYESGHAETTIGGMEKELKMSTRFWGWSWLLNTVY